MTFAQKKYLILPQATEEDSLADRERILQALGDDNIRMTLPALRELYPTLQKSNYRVTVTLSPAQNGWDIIHVEPGDTTGRLFGLALDLGSTTLNMELLDMNSGKTISESSCVNSQSAISSNILDRIIYVKGNSNHLSELQHLVLGDINRLISSCCESAQVSADEISVLAIGGNTTMIHLLTGCEPWLVFQSPYAPVFYDPGILTSTELGITLRCNVYCMPAVANYLGGDITSGLLMTDMDTSDGISIFLDVGTNGELALGGKDFLLVGAGAAGPALEGAVSQSGMRAESGAVCSVTIDNDNVLRYETIDGVPPMGICGSGIVDLIAQGYLCGWINGSGSLNPERSSAIVMTTSSDREAPVPAIIYAHNSKGDPLLFTEEDIVEFIKCKAAAHTMVATLMDYSGVTPDMVDTFYLSGGFGTHLKLESAITIGLYPDLPREKFKILGNSSLSGVKRLLMDNSCISRLKHFVEYSTYIQFGALDKFLENMIAAEFIPHTNMDSYPSVKRRI